MEMPLRRIQQPVRQLCRHAQTARTAQAQRQLSAKTTPSLQTSIRGPQSRAVHITRRQQLATLSGKVSDSLGSNVPAESDFMSNEESLLAAQRTACIILDDEGTPSHEIVMVALDTIERAGSYLVKSHNLERPRPAADADNATSALFSLAARHASRSTGKAQSESASVRRTIDALSNLAYEIAVHPPVFLSPQVLAKYVDVQVLLLRPDTLPEIFDRYSHKPAASTSKKAKEVTYTTPNPTAIAAAIEAKVANRALDAAIHVRDLPLALSIIETTFRAPSFGRAKIFTKALPPMVGAALAPVAAWTLASQLAEGQTGLAPETFQQVAFAGMLTYMGCVGTIGYVALTTANDQMQRVTWAVGMPLRTRWLREEERAALDRVALAWGLRDKGMWGEEEGDEWDELKEWIGLRGMVLDKVGLMEGME